MTGNIYGTKSGDYIHLVGGGGENGAPFEWWKHEFPGLELDDRNYLNYTKLLAAALPDPGWQTQRHALIFDDDTEVDSNSGFAVLRLPQTRGARPRPSNCPLRPSNTRGPSMCGATNGIRAQRFGISPTV